MSAPNWKPEPALRCEPWLAYVRTLPSVVDGMRPCVAHHVIGGRYSTLKASDFLTFPLTDSQHKVLHDKGWRAWESMAGSQDEFACMTLRRGIADGVLVWRNDANLGHWTETARELERAIREGELVFDKRAAKYAA